MIYQNANHFFKSQKDYDRYYQYYSTLIDDEDDRFKWCVAKIIKKYPKKAKYCDPVLFNELNGGMFMIYNLPTFHTYCE